MHCSAALMGPWTDRAAMPAALVETTPHEHTIHEDTDSWT